MDSLQLDSSLGEVYDPVYLECCLSQSRLIDGMSIG
jgi:hypothetical protein